MATLHLALAILLEVIATSALAKTQGFTRPLPTALVALGYGGAFYCLSLALRVWPVGIAYALWSGFGIVLVSAVGWVLHSQKLDAAALLGIGLILAGVLVINLLSNTTGH